MPKSEDVAIFQHLFLASHQIGRNLEPGKYASLWLAVSRSTYAPRILTPERQIVFKEHLC